MDSLTHLALGHLMGAFTAGSTPAAQTGAYWGAFVGNSLPDIDVPFGHLVGRGWAYHRKLTHTLPGIAVLSLAAAGVIQLADRGASYWLTFGWAVAGCAVHLFMDSHNLFGVRPFAPFVQKAFGWGILFIVDPVILTVSGLGSIGQIVGLLSRQTVRWLYVFIWLYLAVRCMLWGRLLRRLNSGESGRTDLLAYLASWRYFREWQDRLEYGRVSLNGTCTPLGAVQKAQGPAVDASRTAPRVQAYLRRARYPYAQVEQTADGGYRVLWQDLYHRLRGATQPVEVLLDSGLQLR
ncbi:MAG: metal-dependent hydrolase [Mycobacterium leprae]